MGTCPALHHWVRCLSCQEPREGGPSSCRTHLPLCFTGPAFVLGSSEVWSVLLGPWGQDISVSLCSPYSGCPMSHSRPKATLHHTLPPASLRPQDLVSTPGIPIPSGLEGASGMRGHAPGTGVEHEGYSLPRRPRAGWSPCTSLPSVGPLQVESLSLASVYPSAARRNTSPLRPTPQDP